MTVHKTPSTLVGTGSSPVYPRLDLFEGQPGASGS
jgi:hypothetical protein